jgi:mannosyltransferase
MIDSVNTHVTETKIKPRAIELLENPAVQYAVLGSIILIATLMRFYKLGEWGFWIDEAFTLFYLHARLHELWTPLSFRLIALTIGVLGVSDWSARLAPALIGIVTIPILYFPTRKLFGPGVALLAVALIALSPWHLHWSQNARFYSALLLFYTLGAFAFYHWLERDRFIYLVAAGIFLLLATMERMNALFFGPAAAVYFLVVSLVPSFGKPAGFRWRNLLLLAAPVILFVFYQVVVAGMLTSLNLNIFGRAHNPLRVLFSVIYDVGLPLFITGFMGGVYLLVKKNRTGLYIFLGALVPVLLLVLMAPFTQAFSRYVFMTLPFWAILGAVAVKEVFSQIHKSGRIVAVSLLLILFAEPISQNVLYYEFQHGNREDFKSAFAYVEQDLQPEDLVVTTRPPLAVHYLGVDPIDSNQIDMDGIAAGSQRAWFVMDSRTFISDRLQQWLNEKTELKAVYDVYQPGKLVAMRVYLFDPDSGK